VCSHCLELKELLNSFWIKSECRQHGTNRVEIYRKSNLSKSCVDVLQGTSNLVISRRCFLRNVKQICQNEKTHVRDKQHVQKSWCLLIKYADLWRPHCWRRCHCVKRPTLVSRNVEISSFMRKYQLPNLVLSSVSRRGMFCNQIMATSMQILSKREKKPLQGGIH